MRVRSLLVLPVAVALGGTLAAVTPATASTPQGVPRPPSRLHWTPCPDKQQDGKPSPAQCTSIRVPVDWSHPAGRRITIALSRLPATKPSQRVGALIWNPGGPGGAGARGVAAAPQEFQPQLREHFDIIGFDPRGTGASTPVRCPGTALPAGRKVFPRTAADYATIRHDSASYGAGCLAHTTPGLLQHLDTRQTVHDIDAVRSGLGEAKISWFGISYGTFLGQTYARLFPHRVRTMVLDGAVDHATGPVTFLAEESAAVEDVFGRFAAWCDRTTSCALHGQNVLAVWDRLLARAARAPIPAPKAHTALDDDAIRLTLPNTLIIGPTNVFGFPVWSSLARGIAAAAKGDASLLAQVTSVNNIDPVYVSTGCLDLPPQLRGYADVRSRLRLAHAVAPHTGGASEAWQLSATCSAWPIAPTFPWGYRPVTQAPPILVVSNRHDPSTPLVWAQGMHQQIKGSRLLVTGATGHTGFLNSPCARNREASYLVTGRMPDLRC